MTHSHRRCNTMLKTHSEENLVRAGNQTKAFHAKL